MNFTLFYIWRERIAVEESCRPFFPSSPLAQVASSALGTMMYYGPEPIDKYLHLDKDGCVNVLYTMVDDDTGDDEVHIPTWIREEVAFSPLDRLLDTINGLRFSIDAFFQVRVPMMLATCSSDPSTVEYAE